MNVNDLLERARKAEKQWRVCTRYAHGIARHHDTATEAQAENFAFRQRRKIGKALIDRETGKAVCVTAVDIVKI